MSLCAFGNAVLCGRHRSSLCATPLHHARISPYIREVSELLSLSEQFVSPSILELPSVLHSTSCASLWLVRVTEPKDTQVGVGVVQFDEALAHPGP